MTFLDWWDNNKNRFWW